MRATLKGIRLILHVCVGLIMAVAVRLGLSRWVARERLVQWWNTVLLDIFDIRVRITGRPAEGARMTVANHVSWMDIPLMAATEPTRFVSKSEVRHWPIAGMLADAAGTFYIRRGKGGARPLLERLVPHLKSGGSIVIYPEGTTTDGRQVLDFHSRLFAAAVESGCPVQPVAIRYSETPDGRAIAPFIGDDDLLHHLLRWLREPQLGASVSYLEPIPSAGLGRNELAERALAKIREALDNPAPEYWPDIVPLQKPA